MEADGGVPGRRGPLRGVAIAAGALPGHSPIRKSGAGTWASSVPAVGALLAGWAVLLAA
jgi:hypothetical protein